MGTRSFTPDVVPVAKTVNNEKFDLNVGDLIPGDFVEDKTFTPGGSEAAPAVNLVEAVDTAVVVEKSVKTEAITQASVPYSVKAKDLETVLSPTPRTGYDAASQRKLAKDNPLSSVTNASIIDLICEGPIEGFSDEFGQTLRNMSPLSHEKNRESATESFQSIFLDDTPIMTKGGQLNFRRFDHTLRRGLPDQKPINRSQGRTLAINKTLYPNNLHIKIKNIPSEVAGQKTEGDTKGGDATLSDTDKLAASRKLHRKFRDIEKNLNPITHTIVDQNVSVAVVAINIHALTRSVTGKRSVKVIPHEINFLIYAGNEGDEIEADFFENSVLIEAPGKRFASSEAGGVGAAGEATADGLKARMFRNDTGGYFLRRLSGLATSDYIFETIIHFPPNPRRRNRVIRVSRLDPDADFNNTEDQRTAQSSLRSVTEIVPYKMNHPNSALVGTSFDSRAYATIPKRNYLLKLQKVKVPSNYLPDVKRYDGSWDGKFKTKGSFLSNISSRELLGGQPYIFTREGAKFRHKAIADFTGGKGFAIDTTNKKSGAGSLEFKQQGNENNASDKVIMVYDGGSGANVPFSNWQGAPGVKSLGMANFGHQNFTIEFHVKIDSTKLQKIYDVDGNNTHPAGLAGVSRTIVASDNNLGLGVINLESTEDAATGKLSEAELSALATETANKVKKGQGSQGILGGAWKVSVNTSPAGEVIFQHFVSNTIDEFINKPEISDTDTVYGWDEDRYQASVAAQDESSPIPRRFSYSENIKLLSNDRIADGSWHHIAIVRNGTTIKMFIDGTEQVQANREATDTPHAGGHKLAQTTAQIDSTHAKNLGRGIYGVRVHQGSGDLIGRGELQIGGTRTPRVVVGGTHYENTFVGHLDNLHIANSALYGSDGPTASQRENIKNTFTSRLLMPFDTSIGDFVQTITDTDYFLSENKDTSQPLLQWTDNPAWIFYDLATNPRYGMGKYGIKEKSVDKWSLYEISKYCDELVKTGFPPVFPERPFVFVDDDPGLDPAADDYAPPDKAGTSFIKITGFANQVEFQTEFPEGKIVNIYNLNDKKNTAYQRQIKYLRSSTGDINKADAGSGDVENLSHATLLSYQSDNSEDAADAIVEIQEVVSVEEALQVDHSLKIVLYELLKKWPGATEKDLIFAYMNSDKGRGSLVQKAFDIGKKINDTSASGKICAELSKDYPFLEPRFTANVYIDGVTDGLRVLNDIAAVFRGITYYAGGRVIATFDKDRDPVMVFTNSNVAEGTFTYAGSSKSDRFTVCRVRFNDKRDKYKQRIEFIEDPNGIIKYGYNEKDLAALGCTSRGQARRLGRWLLYTAQYETETVSFVSGKAAGYLRPGDVVKVMDKNRVSEKNFGTVVGFPENEDGKLKLKVDSEVNEKYIGQKITITIAQRFTTTEKLDYLADHNYITNENTLGIETAKVSDQEIADLRKTQLHEFTIKNIEQDTSVIPSQNIIIEVESHEADVGNFGKIKIGAAYSIQRLSEDIKIKEDLFRIVNIKQEDQEQYTIEGLEYNGSKHETVDFFEELSQTRQRAVAAGTKPAKMINPPKLNIVQADDAQHRNLLVSWDQVTPTPYAYHVVLQIYPQQAIDWLHDAEAGDTAGTDEFGIKSLSASVLAQDSGGQILPTNVIINIGSYFGEVVARIYTVDENGNAELVYF